MLKNYFKIAFRNLKRDRLYVFTNILGLAIGIGVCFIIALYIQGELSYDNYHENQDRVFRLIEETDRNGDYRKSPYSSYEFSLSMEQEIPEIEQVATLRPGNKIDYFIHDDRQFRDIEFEFTESEIFDALTIPLLHGSKQGILDNPSNIAISADLAEQIFGTQNVVGETIDYNYYKSGNQDSTKILTITGIFENQPANTHLEFDALLSFEHLKSTRLSLNNSQFYNYVILAPEADLEQVKSLMSEVALSHYGNDFYDLNNYQFHFQPLSDIYMGEEFADRNGNTEYISVFSIIAMFILLIAIFNYMNLATARSGERAKEVGIRKVVGAGKTDLIRQFLGESIIYSLLAIPIALAMLDIFLPYFNELLNSSIKWNLLENIELLLLVASGVVLAGIISALYPAFLVSSFQPSKVLKGSNRTTTGNGAGLRKSLIIIQFTASSILIISTLIISQQLNFIQNKNLGFDEELLVSVDMGLPTNRANDAVIKSEFEANPYVEKAAKSFGEAGLKFASMSAPISRIDSSEISAQLNHGRIDADFISTMNINIVAGQDFSSDNISQMENGCLINESAARKLGWINPEEAIGQTISTYYREQKTILGIVEDFHFKSVYSEIEPLIMMSEIQGFEFFPTLNLRLKAGNLSEAVASLTETWTAVNPGVPFDYQFLDEAITSLYEREQKISQLFQFFAFIAIIISCIGLLGLMAFTAERRTKEIGIRKVMGASIANIVALLSKDFVKLVILGFVISIPIAWYAMNQWLADFAYRIEIGPGIFALAGVTALVIALLTVSWQSIKAAVANPVDSLRSE